MSVVDVGVQFVDRRKRKLEGTQIVADVTSFAATTRDREVARHEGW